MVSVDSPVLDVDESERTVSVVLDRPDKRNAFNLELVNELYDALVELEERSDKGILLTGNGPVTTAGADVSIVGGDDEDKKRELTGKINDVYELLHRYPRPTVMAVKGAAVGAGFQLAIAVDFAVAGEETTLLKPEVEYGVFSGYSTRMIAHEAGNDVAREIALGGKTITPERAQQWGLISEVVADSAVEETAIELLEELVEYDPGAYEATKQALRFDHSPDDFDNYP